MKATPPVVWTKETHQPCQKCETDDCSFEACSEHVSKNRSSRDSSRIDHDFVRSETAELEIIEQFLRRLTKCIAGGMTSDLVQADSVDAALKHLQS